VDYGADIATVVASSAPGIILTGKREEGTRKREERRSYLLEVIC
jgi:hypothetical protein